MTRSNVPAGERLASLDAFRGFIMLAMASSGLGLAKVAQKLNERDTPQSVWNELAYQFDHVKWTGCGFWDLIQPAFMFMVGVALPYSFASRRANGDSTPRIIAHAVFRSVMLVLLAVFLSSTAGPRTNWVFTNVLAQIGLGYPFLYLVLGRGWKVQLSAVAALLGACWLAFYLQPPAPEDFDWSAVGVSDDWEPLRGLAAHWNKNANFAATFDLWFLNLFPRSEPFRFNEGGYQTLNFVPSLATMIFGVMAGELLRSDRTPRAKRNLLVAAGAACLLLGLAIDHTIWPERLLQAGDAILFFFRDRGPVPPDFDAASLIMDANWSLCPIVKRIWTPSWAIFSTGWTLWMLAAFYWIIDMEGVRHAAFPFTVVGMNSIAAYCMAQLLKPWLRATLKTHLGQDIFEGICFGRHSFDPIYAPIAESIAFLIFLWLICFWMYRRKIFLKI